jgi:glycosyltransferase involved in cell wall biosynthesis
MRLLLINATANIGSTGRIAEEIGKAAISSGFETWFAYGRNVFESQVRLIRIGTNRDLLYHGIKSRLLDNHGFASSRATRQFITDIRKIKPDIINIHNLHGYYLNVEVLFDYLKSTSIPIIWTLHDCWPFTGHCAHFERAGCLKWQTKCQNCPNKRGYPQSWIADHSEKNFINKKKIFTGLSNLSIVSPSKWLSKHLKNSFLKEYPVYIINNGIDLEIFNIRNNNTIPERYNLNGHKIILGVAGTWKKRKALDDFVSLSRILKNDEKIVLVGINKKQAAGLPKNIITVERTENIQELAAFYSTSDVFVNPTYADNFPTTNLEALACGIPVITYNTGGSKETINEITGMVVERGNVTALRDSINKVLAKGKDFYRFTCRNRAENLYDKNRQSARYMNLMNDIINNNII